MDDMKRKAKEMMLQFLEMALEGSSVNVPQPMPIIEKKAKERLDTDGIIAFQMMLREWNKLSSKNKKIISKLLLLNAYNIIETMNIGKELVEEVRDTASFVDEYPEYGKQATDPSSIAKKFTDLFED
jgi:hypothetical protein